MLRMQERVLLGVYVTSASRMHSVRAIESTLRQQLVAALSAFLRNCLELGTSGRSELVDRRARSLQGHRVLWPVSGAANCKSGRRLWGFDFAEGDLLSLEGSRLLTLKLYRLWTKGNQLYG